MSSPPSRATCLGLRANGCSPGPRDHGILGQKSGGAAGRCSPVLQVQLPQPSLRCDPARECAGPRSPHLPALISAATRSRVVPVLLQPDAPARRCGARPRDATPVRGSAALLTAEPARRAAAATPRASPAPSAPPLGPPLSCPSPPRSAPPPPRCGGAHPGKCRRRVPATPPSRSSSRATDYKFQQAARPAHALTGEAAEAKQARPPAAAPRSLRSCHRGLAAGLAGGLAGASS